VAVEQRGHARPPQGGRVPLRDGLDHGRPAGVDGDSLRPDPLHAVPDRGQRHARRGLVPLHLGRVRRPDRRAVRRDVGIRRPALVCQSRCTRS
jgi:hypothetical protein